MDEQTLEKLLANLVDEVGGDWMLAGGALVRLVFDANRGTEDIDLMRISHPEDSMEVSLNLIFRHAIGLGLGPEWINTAMTPFVRMATGWESELALLRTGKKGRLHRPTLTLFTFLKLERGSEVDLNDIIAAFRKLNARSPTEFSEEKLLSWLTPQARLKWQTHRDHILGNRDES
jgi:hypothetical protein